MKFVYFSILALVPLCLLSCRETTSSLGTSVVPAHVTVKDGLGLPAQPDASELRVWDERRISVVSLKVLGHPMPEYQKRVSRFDVGVALVGEGEEASCVLLEPQPEYYQSLPWAPLDFYFNAPEAVKADLHRGEADVFFVGDEQNRAASEMFSYDTVLMDQNAPEIQFLETYREPTQVTFYIGFDKGSLKYNGLLRVRAVKENGGCVAEARLCNAIIKTAEGHTCDPEGWTKRIDEIRAHVDMKGVFTGNPVSKLDVRVINSKTPEYEVVADL